MTKVLLYLLESSAVLAFFYLLYLLVLRRETFFSLNRFYLLGILTFSLLFPFVSFDFNSEKVAPVERPIEEISKFRMSYYEAMTLWEFNGYNASVRGSDLESKPIVSDFDWGKFSFKALFVIYVIGIVICLSRLFWTFRWVWNLIVHYPQEEIDGIKIINVPHPIAPFSFLKYVFVSEGSLLNPEFKQVLAHEKTHIKEGHSIDLIFVQLLAAFYWFNPVIWQLIKSLKTNHEYIADKTIINSGYSLVEYQTLLLRQLISNNSYGLVHNFNLSFIKKRITMMKNKKSGWAGKVKVAMALASTIMFSAIIVQCNSKFEEPASIESQFSSAGFDEKVTLPILPETQRRFEGDLSEALHFTIANNKLTIDGEAYEVGEIGTMLEKSAHPQRTIIVMNIDQDQTMGFVRDVQTELRRADKRMMLYLGKTATEQRVEIPLLLPPTRENAAKHGWSPQPEISELESEGRFDILKIRLGNNTRFANQQLVYDFVNGHVQKQSQDYVVSLDYQNKDLYKDYLVNLVHITEGFNTIYQERAQTMFGKNFNEIEKEEFQAVRQGVPMAISIADPK